ncbi:MAG: CDP-alcohol phosphatidyltransferase family protein [Fidelibacterota bacterium]|nr:MAG: CDP-alcohol phosphatidyltransferase family protein [Candidatus Neomarinimicrobiota bacterium]
MRRASDRILTISNILSFTRAALSIPLVWALETDRMSAVLIMILLAVVSDFLDGFLARHAHAITDVGKILDPLADKFILLAVMIFLIFDPERQFPIYFFLLLGLRDIMLSIIATYLMNRRAEIFQSNLAGKWFMSVTALAMILYVLKFTEPGFWFLLVATVLMLVSWYLYLKRYSKYLKALPGA